LEGTESCKDNNRDVVFGQFNGRNVEKECDKQANPNSCHDLQCLNGVDELWSREEAQQATSQVRKQPSEVESLGQVDGGALSLRNRGEKAAL